MALSKLISNEVGVSANYHRIVESKIDFDINQQTIIIKSYTDETYRNKEKTQLAEIETKISRYYELVSKESLTEEEISELQLLNIQELEARKITDLSINTVVTTIPISEDTRAKLYDIIESTIPIFDGSTAI